MLEPWIWSGVVLFALGGGGSLTLVAAVRPLIADRNFSDARIRRLELLSVVQSLVLVALAGFGGAALVTGTGLGIGFFVLLTGQEGLSQTHWLGTLVLASVWGLLCGSATPRMAPALLVYLRQFPTITRLGYGALTEEVLFRWGLFALLLSIPLQNASLRMGVAVASVTLIFSLLHYPAINRKTDHGAGTATLFVLGVSLPWALFALFAGIESAILSHFFFHIAILSRDEVLA